MKSWAVKKAREIDEKEAEEAKKQNTYNNQQAQIGRDTQVLWDALCDEVKEGIKYLQLERQKPEMELYDETSRGFKIRHTEKPDCVNVTLGEQGLVIEPRDKKKPAKYVVKVGKQNATVFAEAMPSSYVNPNEFSASEIAQKILELVLS
jgi:hypothetical protein